MSVEEVAGSRGEAGGAWMIGQPFPSSYQGTLLSLGSEALIPLQESQDFAAACAREGIAVLGIEVFLVEDGMMMPLDEHIYELESRGSLSWQEYVGKCHEACLRVSQVIPIPDAYLSFVLASERQRDGDRPEPD